MAELKISLSDFVSGNFPEVCAVTGNLASSRYRLVAVRPPFVAGAVPLSRVAARRLSFQRFGVVVAFSIGLATFLLGLATSLQIIAWFGIGLFIAGGLTLGILRRYGLAAIPQEGAEAIVLRNVHSDFVAAVEAPPGKCAGCSAAHGCSLNEMASCKGPAD